MKCRHPDNGQAAQGVNGVKSFDRLHASDYLKIRHFCEAGKQKLPANVENKETSKPSWLVGHALQNSQASQLPRPQF